MKRQIILLITIFFFLSPGFFVSIIPGRNFCFAQSEEYKTTTDENSAVENDSGSDVSRESAEEVPEKKGDDASGEAVEDAKESPETKEESVTEDTETNEEVTEEKPGDSPEENPDDTEKDTPGEENLDADGDGKIETGENPEKETPAEEPVAGVIDKKEKIKDSFGIGVYIGGGTMVPVADYGDRYNTGYVFSLSSSLYRFSYFGFVPEAHSRVSGVSSIDRPGKVDSSFFLFQFSAGVSYHYVTALPGFLSQYDFFKKDISLYGRITEGITRVAFDSENEPATLVEYINTVELSTGFLYPVYDNFEAGIDFGYRVIATADSFFHSLNFSAVVGYRF